MAEPFPNDAIIPARAEGILALRWKKLAEREGHKSASPSDETRNRQQAVKAGMQAAAAHHANKIKGEHTRALALTAIKDGCETVPDISQRIGMSIEATRKAVRILGEQGKVKKIGTVAKSGGQANRWRAVK